MKIALLHDYLIRFGGAERVLHALHEMFPEAPIYTLLYKKEITDRFFPHAEVHGSLFQTFPSFVRNRHRWLLPFYPVAAETIELRDFDLVISSSSAFIKGVITRPQTIHVSYIHAPSRFLWDWSNEYVKGFPFSFRLLIKPMRHYLRVWDRQAAQRPDYLLANSVATKEKIWKYYRREAEIIYPPVEIPGRYAEESGFADRGDNFFLIVSYLTPYKRVDLAIEAFNKLELPLVIIGDGPERKRLEKRASRHITFLGSQSEEVKHEYYTRARALVFPGEDDFGMTAVEAMMHGKPVLAYKRGGVIETVREGVTGEFFDDPTPEVLADGVRRLNKNFSSYDPLRIRNYAQSFSRAAFVSRFQDFITRTSSL